MKLSHRSSGNVLFMILIAIVLFAGLTAVMSQSDKGTGSLSNERTNLAADRIGAAGVDIKRAVDTILRGGNSETTVSFAHASLTGYGTPDTAPKVEVFNIAGGGATFIDLPDGVNNGSQWEFTAATAAPGVGDDATADLIMVLPNVTEKFCRAYNKKAGYTPEQAIPTDTGACVYDTSARFAGTFPTSGVNTMDAGTFRATPAPFACVVCGTAYHAYYTLIER